MGTTLSIAFGQQKRPRCHGASDLIDKVSVVLNEAEGNARRSKPERRRFFEMARASTAEVAACVDLMFAFGLIDRETTVGYKSRLVGISKMLWGLMR